MLIFSLCGALISGSALAYGLYLDRRRHTGQHRADPR